MRQETENLKKKYVIYFHLKWRWVNIKEDSRSTGNLCSDFLFTEAVAIDWRSPLFIPPLWIMNPLSPTTSSNRDITFKLIPLPLGERYCTFNLTTGVLSLSYLITVADPTCCGDAQRVQGQATISGPVMGRPPQCLQPCVHSAGQFSSSQEGLI